MASDAGKGDSAIESCPTEGSFPTATLLQAIAVIREADAPTADAIDASRLDGGVSFVNLTAPPVNLGGVADANTIGLAPDLTDDIEALAALILHEWHHVKQTNGAPDAAGQADLPAACQESHAYTAQLAFMCSLMQRRQTQEPLSGLRPYHCSQVRSIYVLHFAYALLCFASGGTPPQAPACNSNYCLKA